MIKSRGANGKATVTFTVDPRVGAQTAAVCGEWNDWSAGAGVMRRDAEGGFSLTVDLEAGRTYRFRYLLDGERWDNDRAAGAYVPNSFAGDDSVVDLTALAEAIPPAGKKPPAKKPRGEGRRRRCRPPRRPPRPRRNQPKDHEIDRRGSAGSGPPIPAAQDADLLQQRDEPQPAGCWPRLRIPGDGAATAPRHLPVRQRQKDSNPQLLFDRDSCSAGAAGCGGAGCVGANRKKDPGHRSRVAKSQVTNYGPPCSHLAPRPRSGSRGCRRAYFTPARRPPQGIPRLIRNRILRSTQRLDRARTLLDAEEGWEQPRRSPWQPLSSRQVEHQQRDGEAAREFEAQHTVRSGPAGAAPHAPVRQPRHASGHGRRCALLRCGGQWVIGAGPPVRPLHALGLALA